MADSSSTIPGPAVLVVGAGASGLAAARCLYGMKRQLLVTDARAEREIANASEFRSLGADLAFGGHPPELLDGMNLLVVSPGVPPWAPILHAAYERGVPVMGELELGYRALGEPSERIVAVTGTKGKSSVVTILAEALRRHELDAVACGNLGAPLSSLVSDFGPEAVAVVEASSFQLTTIERFRARVAVLLAVGEDHLDWHPDLFHYRSAKARIFENQTTDDWALFDRDDRFASRLATKAASQTGAKLLPFSGTEGAEATEMTAQVSVERGFVVRKDDAGVECLASLSALSVPGAHQQRNFTAAAAAASLFGARREAIEAAAKDFTGMPHALQQSQIVDGVRFINDSRATSLVATAAALDALAAEGASHIELILGGILKGGRFPDLEPHLGPVARILALGQTHVAIAGGIRSVPVRRVRSLDEAVERGFETARAQHPRGIVLLSPGCSSFDMFANFRQRGELFNAAARRIANEHGIERECSA